MSNDKLAEALREAAASLRTLERSAMREEYLDDPYSVRAYARSRAEVAENALQAHAAEAAHPQPAQDASNPLKGWIFDKVDMGRGDERYICTPDGANATTVSNESTSDHRERMLWLIADAMAKESGR